MREYLFFVYIMASKSRVLYTGITSNLHARVFQQKTGEYEGFTKRYRVHRLVYFECWKYVHSAIAREKQIKVWTRQQRVKLIESINPTWEDLAADWFSSERVTHPNEMYLKHDPHSTQTFSTATDQPLRLPKCHSNGHSEL
jgi:putative endonuclease